MLEFGHVGETTAEGLLEEGAARLAVGRGKFEIVDPVAIGHSHFRVCHLFYPGGTRGNKHGSVDRSPGIAHNAFEDALRQPCGRCCAPLV
ncbi:MAG: hypothetical protein Q8L54_07395 [Devosia sp.]|nr:hypothetical protein [Devosia sp.]